MSMLGKIMSMISPSGEVIFPRTKINAVSDENGIGLDVVIEELGSQLMPITGGSFTDVVTATNSVRTTDVNSPELYNISPRDSSGAAVETSYYYTIDK